MPKWELVLAPVLIATATPPPLPPSQPYYECALEPQYIAGGLLTMSATVYPDGPDRAFRAAWTLEQRNPYTLTELSWEGPDAERILGEPRVRLTIGSDRVSDGFAMLLRNAGAATSPLATGPGAHFVPHGWDSRSGANPPPVVRGYRRWWVEVRLPDLDAAARAPDGVRLVLRDRERQVIVARRRIDAASLRAAVAFVRGEGRGRLEAMLADYRSRCPFTPG